MPFTFGERLGMFFPIEGGCFSAVAVSLVLFIALFKWLRRSVSSFGRGNRRGPDATDNSIFLNLMLADLIQALGYLPIIKWMVNGAITEGRLCTAQAVVKQVGIVGVATTSLAIAVHTFCVLVLRWSAPNYISKLVVLMIWIFTALVIGIPNIIHMKVQYYGNTGYWCWIKSEFKTEQIVTEYFYPAVYIICILPNSLSRWLSFSGFNVPYQFILAANTIFSLSGMFNAILFFLTRPDLVVGPSDSPPPTQDPTDPRILGQSHHHRDETELTSYSSQKFGSLPTGARSPGGVGGFPDNFYVAPDLEKDYNSHSSGYLRTYNSNSRMLPAEGGGGGGGSLGASPFVRDSDSTSHVPSNLSGERSYGDFRSMAAVPVEGETYGHLPG
ncbi:hypothetical protein M413DRAFT_24685 [Hebeloma cylindrosporum]|uniref:Uncharacterized protein n=1 Tax=Hebeloma cylindrosporum TaxID=76867 RepID=A0A0C3C9H5_HEBCY|nr:hypothetical protein M413DRAFT_24685 [Hebeloma cylindrosporum h7]